MITAQFKSTKKTNIGGVITLAVTVALVLPASAGATVGSAQNCTTATACTIGEFLYNDEYNPETGGTCTMTSKYPDGTAHLTSQAMTLAADGWYSYTFTAPSTTGYYRTQVCCTIGADYLCLDKSFEVQNAVSSAPSASAVAAAVWGYSDRTMSSFGNLTADVWGYSSRTLSGFGNLVSDIWNHSSRSVSGTQSTLVTTIETTTQETRLLLEQMINKPIIQNSIETEDVDLQGKIQSSLDMADRLLLHHQYIHSKTGLMDLKWHTSTMTDITAGLRDIDAMLGTETDNQSADTVFGAIVWLGNQWKWPVLDDITNQAQAIKATLRSIRLSAQSGKTTDLQKEIESLATYVETLDQLIGGNITKNQKNTLMGQLHSIRDIAQQLRDRDTELDGFLAGWSQKKATTVGIELPSITQRVLAINHIPQAPAILQTSQQRKNVSFENRIKNGLLSLKGLLQANTLLLARGPESAVLNTWLEVGSVVFKSLLINPSTLVSQEVPLKYYLPAELAQEDIIETSKELSIAYDAEKNQLYAQGNFTLSPGESRTVEVRAQDKWDVSEELVESMRRQAAELSRPLEKTAFFAQGVTLKSDVEVSLDKALVFMQDTATPDRKIRSFRHAEIEINAAQQKLDKLKDLVTQAGSAGTVFGFIGGVQVLAVWGLIIIMGAGFVFLTLYMRVLIGHQNAFAQATIDDQPHAKKKKPRDMQMRFHIFAFLVFGLITSIISGVTVGWTMSRAHASSRIDTRDGASVVSPVVRGVHTPESNAPETDDIAFDDIEVLTVVAPQGMEAVNVRKRPTTQSTLVHKLPDQEPVVKLESEGQWTRIAFIDRTNAISEGWVRNDYLVALSSVENILSDSTTRP